MNTCFHTPIVYRTDVVILGGSLAALSAALTLSGRQRQVLVVTKETFLLEDICLPHFYFFRKGEARHPLLQTILGLPGTESEAGDQRTEEWALLHPDRLKLHAEDLLLKSGIPYLYAAAPLDRTETRDGWGMLRIAGKFGIHGIECRKVLDLRYTAPRQDRFLMDVTKGPALYGERRVGIREKDGTPNEVIVRRGPYGKGHITLDMPLDVSANVSANISANISTNVSTNDSANASENALMDVSMDASGAILTDRRSKKPEELFFIRRKRAFEVFRQIKEAEADFADMEPGRLAHGGYSSRYRMEEEVERGIAAALDSGAAFTPDFGPAAFLPSTLQLDSFNDTISFFEEEIVQGGVPGVNTVKQGGLVVAGGGTADAMAAAYAARQGIHTILVEGNRQLGGTGTVGGVSTYWFGRRFKDTGELDERIQKMYEDLGVQRKPGIWSPYDYFNPDVKAFVLMEMCREAGVEILCDTTAFAAICEKGAGKRVRGIAAATPQGICAVLGEYVIDATGDGDIAAFAGADFDYGSGRDAITFWASLAQYTTPGEYRNNFSSTVMVGNLKDYTRFITAGRRRGSQPGNPLYDHGTYVSPRESRHIRGLYEITLKDAVSFTEYEDTLYTCFSNYDPKGKLNADMVYAGVLPPQNAIAVPLRALIPVDRNQQIIDGLLVAGKAISCTHNALPALRMQPDLQHQGAVLGLLAGVALSTRKTPLELDIRKLQDRIRSVTGDPLALEPGTRPGPRELVSALDGGLRLEWTDFPFEEEIRGIPASIAVMTAPAAEILPELEKRYLHEKDPQTRLILARMLLWHGSDQATDDLLEAIMEQLDRHDGLPGRQGSLACVTLLPDHGVMAEPVYLLNLLAWSKKPEIYQPFLEVLDRLEAIQRDYTDNRKSHYHYVEAFAYVAERTGLPQFIPMLRRLLKFSELRNPDEQVLGGILAERQLILKLSLNRALARCGDGTGYSGLAGLLDHPCASVAVSACMELRTLTGMNLSCSTETWNAFFRSGLFEPAVHPVTERFW